MSTRHLPGIVSPKTPNPSKSKFRKVHDCASSTNPKNEKKNHSYHARTTTMNHVYDSIEGKQIIRTQLP